MRCSTLLGHLSDSSVSFPVLTLSLAARCAGMSGPWVQLGLRVQGLCGTSVGAEQAEGSAFPFHPASLPHNCLIPGHSDSPFL